MRPRRAAEMSRAKIVRAPLQIPRVLAEAEVARRAGVVVVVAMAVDVEPPIVEGPRQDLRLGERRPAVAARGVPQVPVAGERGREQLRRVVSLMPMQLNENAVVFESADAWYTARTGPAAPATSAAAPTRAARERSHRPGDIPGPPPAGNERVAELSGCRRGGECRKSGGLPFTRPYRPAPCAAIDHGSAVRAGDGRRPPAVPPVLRCDLSPPRRVVAKPVRFRHSPATVTAVHATAEVRSPAPRQSRTYPREKGAGRHDPDRLILARRRGASRGPEPGHASRRSQPEREVP